MWRKLLIFLVVALSVNGLSVTGLSGQAFAHNYQARLDIAEWRLDPGPLMCRLWQPVPNYGDAVFEIRAGEPLKFYVESYRPVLKPGKADLSIVAPEWKPDIMPKPIGRTAVVTGKRPIVLDEDKANLLLAELEVGMFPSFTHHAWFEKHNVTVDVSAVNFQNAYTGYVSCVAGLFPANFDQLQQSLLHFETDKWVVKGALKERLDLIAGYIALDPSITHIRIDGHTDSDGRRGYNWELSRKRAQAVKDYLEAKGVAPELIEMKYYGEGIPAKNNVNAANKAVNRRVLLRMDKG
ncbi:MAG TPA: OmpA family protein [Dongiaceae bacterium]|nr:OmpA family protein [Dongiaceae bacterium]